MPIAPKQAGLLARRCHPLECAMDHTDHSCPLRLHLRLIPAATHARLRVLNAVYLNDKLGLGSRVLATGRFCHKCTGRAHVSADHIEGAGVKQPPSGDSIGRDTALVEGQCVLDLQPFARPRQYSVFASYATLLTVYCSRHRQPRLCVSRAYLADDL